MLCQGIKEKINYCIRELGKQSIFGSVESGINELLDQEINKLLYKGIRR